MTANNKANNKNKHKVKSWYSNRYQIVLVQRNILMMFTIVSMFSVAVAVIFVKTIMSSKSLEPYVIEVEEKTGIPTIVDQMTSKKLTGDQAIKKYFINKFVHAAVAYDSETYDKDVQMVRLFSSIAVYSDFRRRINKDDLGSATIDVRIKSIQFNKDNSAQVRILQQSKGKQGTSGSESKNMLIDMSFYLVPENNLTEEERYINPLGFQVTNFKITEESFDY